MEIDLRAYTSRVKELEAAIYTQKKLMKSHKKVLNEQHPKAPKRKTINPPQKPSFSEVKTQAGGSVASIFLGLLCIAWFFILDWYLLLIGGIVLCLIGIFLIRSDLEEIKSNKRLNEALKEQFEKDNQEYSRLLQQYNQEVADIDREYSIAMNTYDVNVSSYEQQCSETMDRHSLALTQLENALEQVYNEGVVFPKYRNLVAITAINEYLLSGRCDKLEGPDGAYNLYEMELRQNIIITQLSTIISNLEQIRNNQYSLYQELQKSNILINEILTETRVMRKDTKLIAYFTGVTALAETSPKYYYGITM